MINYYKYKFFKNRYSIIIKNSNYFIKFIIPLYKLKTRMTINYIDLHTRLYEEDDLKIIEKYEIIFNEEFKKTIKEAFLFICENVKGTELSNLPDLIENMNEISEDLLIEGWKKI